MSKKKETSAIATVYSKYIAARDAMKAHLEDLRTEQCIRENCEESDLPEIDRLIIIGKDNDGTYWIFGEDAFYWSAPIELPVRFSNGHMYINPTDKDIDSLLKKQLVHQYVVITSID